MVVPGVKLLKQGGSPSRWPTSGGDQLAEAVTGLPYRLQS